MFQTRKSFVRRTFAYLVNSGYEFRFENCNNIEYEYAFHRMDGSKVSITEDIREHWLELRIYAKQSKLLFSFCSSEDEYNVPVPLKSADQMRDAVKEIHLTSNFRRGMRFDTFQSIVLVYSDFVQRNLDVIAGD